MSKKSKVVGYGGRYYGGNTVMKFIELMRLNFARGNVVKYVSRAGEKDKRTELEDLDKALYYLNVERARVQKERKNGN